MSTSINTNAISLNAQRNLSFNTASLATSVQRLSSGLRVNSAKDDAAGLAIAERMNAQVRGSLVAIRNAQDGISLFQTAEGAMSRITESLQRIRELAVQASNDIMGADDRDNLQAEVDQLTAEINRVITSARFNGLQLLDGTANFTSLQVGADAGDEIDISGAAAVFDFSTLTANGNTPLTIDISGADGSNARAALPLLIADMDSVSSARATAGAFQNRLEAAVNQLQVYSENMAASRGRIMDADYAQETANLSRTQILQQAGTAMVAQANQLPQNVLTLLRS